jgi:preprotein translocase subunit SecG
MVSFSNDADILKYEPILFGELHLPWQVLWAGTGGTLSGTTFTANDADFVAARISAGGVVYLQSADGSLDGAYEVVSVDSATQLSLSVIRSDPTDTAVAPPAATDISYRISTFAPQANEVGFQLTEYFGISPGNPASDIGVEDVLDASVLRLASVFAVISIVYAMLAGKAKDENYWKKSLYYQKLFAKARGQCRLSIDVGADGIADVTKVGASGRLMRD